MRKTGLQGRDMTSAMGFVWSDEEKQRNGDPQRGVKLLHPQHNLKVNWAISSSKHLCGKVDSRRCLDDKAMLSQMSEMQLLPP
jgi:hypothetical protein